jgi:predicted transcriptional regulator
MCDIFNEELIDEYAEELNKVNLELVKKKSKALAERRAAGLNERRRPVVCVETGQIFKTIKEAQEITGLWLKPVLSGQRESVNGYHFKYHIEETAKVKTQKTKTTRPSYFTESELVLLKQQYPKVGAQIPELLKTHSAQAIRSKALYLGITCKTNINRRKYNNQQIICVETQQTFKDIYEAGALFDGSMPSKLILNVCKGKSKLAYGYHWCWLEDTERQAQFVAELESKKIVCVETGKVYDSVSAAAWNTGVNPSSIYSAIKKPTKAPNLHWAYAEDTERIQFIKDNYLYTNNIYTNYTFKPKSVRCVETGVVYSDMTSAAKALGMHGPSHISTACKTGKKSGGYHWEYVEN